MTLARVDDCHLYNVDKTKIGKRTNIYDTSNEFFVPIDTIKL